MYNVPRIYVLSKNRKNFNFFFIKTESSLQPLKIAEYCIYVCMHVYIYLMKLTYLETLGYQ